MLKPPSLLWSAYGMYGTSVYSSFVGLHLIALICVFAGLLLVFTENRVING